MAQGKLHSSPFHIETVQYKYAVENEVPSSTRSGVACKYRDGHTCTLWNSGNSRCLPHRCKYLQKGDMLHALHLNESENCVFCCSKRKCSHPKNPSKKRTLTCHSQVCCFFSTYDTCNPRSLDNRALYNIIKHLDSLKERTLSMRTCTLDQAKQIQANIQAKATPDLDIHWTEQDLKELLQEARNLEFKYKDYCAKQNRFITELKRRNKPGTQNGENK